MSLYCLYSLDTLFQDNIILQNIILMRKVFGICCIQRWKPEANLLNHFCFPNKHYLFATTISSKNDGHACMEYPWIRYNRIRWKKQHHDHNIKHQQKSPFKDLAVQKYISSTTRFFSPFHKHIFLQVMILYGCCYDNHNGFAKANTTGF